MKAKTKKTKAAAAKKPAAAKTKPAKAPTAERKSDAGRLSCKFTKNKTRAIRRVAKTAGFASGQEYVRCVVAEAVKGVTGGTAKGQKGHE